MIDPSLVVFIKIGEVFYRDPLFTFARPLMDALIADIGWCMDVDNAAERGTGADELAVPLLVEIPLKAVDAAVVAEHLGKDVVVGLQAALSDEDVVPRGLRVPRTLCAPLVNCPNCIPVAAEYCAVLERIGPAPLIFIEDL